MPGITDGSGPITGGQLPRPGPGIPVPPLLDEPSAACRKVMLDKRPPPRAAATALYSAEDDTRVTMTELLNTLYVQTKGAASSSTMTPSASPHPNDRDPAHLPLRRSTRSSSTGTSACQPDLLSPCAGDGRDHHVDVTHGRFIGRLDGPPRGNILLRHAQHRPTPTRPRGWPSPG